MIHMKTNDYVDFYMKREYSQVMKDYEVDDLEDLRETLTKNTRNLLREFQNPLRTFDLDNTYIFQYFPLDALSKKEQYDFFDHLMDLKAQDSSVGNKVIHNLKKITYDLSNQRFNDLLLNDITPSPFTLAENNYKDLARSIIRYNFSNVETLLANLENLAKHTLLELSIHDVCTLFNIYTDSIIQSIIYWVVTMPDLTYYDKLRCLDSINTKIDSLMRDVREMNAAPLDNLTLDTVIPLFICILKYRNRCGEHAALTDLLSNEQKTDFEFFQDVPPEYQCAKQDRVTDQNLKLILNEGNRRCDNFESKLEQTKDIIQLLSSYCNRNMSVDSVLDLKVCYRELFISKSKYKTTALHIAKKYADTPPESIPYRDISFLSEKISRGYFREQTPIQLFDYKNFLQQKVNLLMIELFMTYDFKKVVTTGALITTSLLETSFSGINSFLPTIGKKPIL